MTKGSALKQILKFSVPLLIGTIIQQLYSFADGVILGRFMGPEGFAAVGSVGSIVFLILGMVQGTCAGFAIPVAQAFGAGNESGVRRCVANIAYMAVIFAAVMTALATSCREFILNLMDAQPALMGYSSEYLFWIFMGIAATTAYNALAGILRALGDSRTPLYFLIISSLLNIALDIVLVRPFGVAGAAIATVTAQLFSAVLCLIYMRKRYPILRFSKDEMHPDAKLMLKLLCVGIPMGLQYSITAVGEIILQRAVNILGVTVVTSISAASMVHIMTAQPMEVLGSAAATFAGQNYGAGKIDRVRRANRQVYLLILAYSALACLFLCFVAVDVAALFVGKQDPEVCRQMQQYLTLAGVFYPLLGLMILIRNALQGIGYSLRAMMAGVMEMTARILISFVVIPAFGFVAVCLSNLAAWGLALLFLVPAYIFSMKQLQRDK